MAQFVIVRNYSPFAGSLVSREEQEEEQEVVLNDARAGADRMIHIIVYGTPAPQGSKRYLGVSPRGTPRAIEQSVNLPAWRNDVTAAAIKCRLENRLSPLTGPLVARMIFTVRKPSSAPKKRPIWPTGSPDLSKLLRATEDALTSAGIWKDDALVVDYTRVAKVYPGEDSEALDAPGVRINISPVVNSLEELPRS